MALFGRSFLRTRDIFFFVLVFSAMFLFLAQKGGFDLRSRARGEPANIIVDATSSAALIDTDFYHAFSQGGEEKGDMLGPVIDKVKALHPKYIRIDHLYDGFDIVGGTEQALTYDWSRFDTALDTIRATGATPVLALSYMPAVIAKEGKIINPPTNWQSWSDVVQKTIEHVSGTKNIPGVYYEVWNEPDLDQFGSWKYYGEKNYLSLYSFAIRGVEQVKGTQPFFVGGPVTTALYPNWINAFVAAKPRIDFFSWHVYSGKTTEVVNQVTKLQALVADDQNLAKKPILITEYGFDGGKSTRYGERYAAAYTASVVRSMLDVEPKPALFSFELKDGPGQPDGWGLMTHETQGAQTKPRYQVFFYLDSMKGNRLTLSGEGSWTTGYATKDRGVIRLLLVNIDPEDPRGTHSENVPVTITGLVPGAYKLRQWFFMGADATTTETVATTTWNKQIFLPANQIVILELTKS